MPESPNEPKTEQLESQKTSIYPVPNKSRIVIASNDGEHITSEELLAIAFQIAGENPRRKVEYWIKLSD